MVTVPLSDPPLLAGGWVALVVAPVVGPVVAVAPGPQAAIAKAAVARMARPRRWVIDTRCVLLRTCAVARSYEGSVDSRRQPAVDGALTVRERSGSAKGS